ALSCNKSRLNTCSLNLDFFLLFLVNDLPRCICHHRQKGHWIIDRPCQGRMSQWRYIVCTLPFLICSNQWVSELFLNVIWKFPFISELADFIQELKFTKFLSQIS